MINFSVIIPFKNEKENLQELLDSLSAQKTQANFEVILIDDFSTDAAEPLQLDFIKLLHRKDFPDNPKISSKQNAIDIGVSQAKYEYLIFTDADMIFNENWLENYRVSVEDRASTASTGSATSVDFVFGRTEIIVGGKNGRILSAPTEILQKAQLDFLFAISFVFCKLGLDGSAMGNNLMISKKLYEKIGGQAGIGFSLIEDKKLLSAARKHGAKIFCTKDFSAYAFTKPVPIKKFIQQMLRWVKGGFIESPFLAVALVLFAISNLLIFPSFLLILLLIPVYLKNKISLKYAFLLPFAFFVETLILIPSLFFVKLKWKERII